MKSLAQITIGVIFLAVACWCGAYGSAFITAMTFGILGVFGIIFNFALPFAVTIGLLINGPRPGKRAYAWAPVIFFGGWAVASIMMRENLSLEAARMPPSQIDPSLAKVKTLVVDDFLNTSRTFVSEGVVDRLVEIGYEGNNRSKPISSIRQTTLSRGEACTDEDRARSSELRAVGRTDECLKETELSTVPDGLHILYSTNYYWGANRPGVLAAVVVNDGRKTEVLRWRRFSARVPAYFPLFRMNMGPFDHAQTIWETRSGPFEIVSYGDLDLTSEAMAAAICSFDPSLPPKPKIEDHAALAARASELAAAGDYAAALNIVTLLDQANFLDENMIKTAAYSILDMDNTIVSKPRPDLSKFVDKLDAHQVKVLNDEIIRILTTPAKCRCRAFLFNSTDLGQRAVDAFLNTSGLRLWQYKGLLTATHYVATPFEDHRARLFASILASQDPSNGLRVVSYMNSAGSSLLDAELRALTPKLAELNGEAIYQIAAGSSLSSPTQLALFYTNFNPEIHVKANTWNAFWLAMEAQVARIEDAKQRERAAKAIREKPHKAKCHRR